MPNKSDGGEQTKLQTLLRTLRREAGLSQMALSQILHRPQSFVSKYESGERRLDVIELREVCEAMGLHLSAFVERLEQDT